MEEFRPASSYMDDATMSPFLRSWMDLLTDNMTERGFNNTLSGQDYIILDLGAENFTSKSMDNTRAHTGKCPKYWVSIWVGLIYSWLTSLLKLILSYIICNIIKLALFEFNWVKCHHTINVNWLSLVNIVGTDVWVSNAVVFYWPLSPYQFNREWLFVIHGNDWIIARIQIWIFKPLNLTWNYLGAIMQCTDYLL